MLPVACNFEARGVRTVHGILRVVRRMGSQIAIHRTTRLKSDSKPQLGHALRLVPAYERAVREVSKMFSQAGIRHALVGALGANAYRDRPRTTADIDFLVGDEAFEKHEGGFVTMRVPVVEFDGIDIDQVPLTESLRVIEDGLERAHRSEGVPIAPVNTIVVMKLLAGRSQDLADVGGNHRVGRRPRAP